MHLSKEPVLHQQNSPRERGSGAQLVDWSGWRNGLKTFYSSQNNTLFLWKKCSNLSLYGRKTNQEGSLLCNEKGPLFPSC